MLYIHESLLCVKLALVFLFSGLHLLHWWVRCRRRSRWRKICHCQGFASKIGKIRIKLKNENLGSHLHPSMKDPLYFFIYWWKCSHTISFFIHLTKTLRKHIPSDPWLLMAKKYKTTAHYPFVHPLSRGVKFYFFKSSNIL